MSRFPQRIPADIDVLGHQPALERSELVVGVRGEAKLHHVVEHDTAVPAKENTNEQGQYFHPRNMYQDGDGM